MKDVGLPINIRRMVHAPTNESGVVLLFGMIAHDLDFYIESISKAFPDCIALAYTGKGRWKQVRIEFEYKSKNFQEHKHDPNDCDFIVCWEHNWEDCPEYLDVIELRSYIERIRLKDHGITETEEDDEKVQHMLDYHLSRASREVQGLYKELYPQIKTIDGEITRRISKSQITYYWKDRSFMHIYLDEDELYTEIFTRGEPLENVSSIKYSALWGKMIILKKNQAKDLLDAVSESLTKLKAAIGVGENTGYFSRRKKKRQR